MSETKLKAKKLKIEKRADDPIAFWRSAYRSYTSLQTLRSYENSLANGVLLNYDDLKLFNLRQSATLVQHNEQLVTFFEELKVHIGHQIPSILEKLNNIDKLESMYQEFINDTGSLIEKSTFFNEIKFSEQEAVEFGIKTFLGIL